MSDYSRKLPEAPPIAYAVAFRRGSRPHVVEVGADRHATHGATALCGWQPPRLEATRIGARERWRWDGTAALPLDPPGADGICQGCRAELARRTS